jgi:hypothetical protein
MTRKSLYERSELKNNDPVWCLIAEYSLNEVIGGEAFQAEYKLGSLYKTLRDLGVQPSYLKKLEQTITGIAPGSSPGLPVLVRLLCQRESIESLSRLEKYRNGGWGYYLIEREQDLPDVPYQERPRVVELYLYKEGE